MRDTREDSSTSEPGGGGLEVLNSDTACPPMAGLLSETLARNSQPVEAAFFPHIACAIFRDRPEFCDKFGQVPDPLEPAVVTAPSVATDGLQKQAWSASRRPTGRLFDLCEAAQIRVRRRLKSRRVTVPFNAQEPGGHVDRRVLHHLCRLPVLPDTGAPTPRILRASGCRDAGGSMAD
jgi:hypothetical protein